MSYSSSGSYLVKLKLPICEYLNETRHGENIIHFMPEDPVKRAKARIIAEIINSSMQPYQNLNVIQRVTKEMGKEKRDEWLKFYVGKGLDSIEYILEETSCEGLYCIDNQVSLADIFLVPQVYSAKRFKINFDKYPFIRSINSNLEKLPEFIKAHAHNQIDTTSKFKNQN
jgi:maleylacetoacetate isomerase